MGEASKSHGSAGAVPSVEATASAGRPFDPDIVRAADVIVGLFRHAGRALRASDFDAPGEWAAALTMPQLRVLYLLGRHPSLPVGSVAEAMRISQPSATETIDRLVRAGYVSRTTCATDRRVVRTALTEAGRTLIDRPWEARRAVLADALADASPAQREVVVRGLETLCELLAENPSSAFAPEKVARRPAEYTLLRRRDATDDKVGSRSSSPTHTDSLTSEDRV